jgi:uncharacterized protein with PhoU and TrkA domain
MRKGIAKLKRRIPRWKRAEFEAIEYEPTNVKTLLTEMKDISELIVDLAYSAALYKSKEIEEEVKYLEVRMDKLNYQIRMIAMLAARDPQDAEQLAGVLQIAEAAESISNAAGNIAALVYSAEATEPIFSYIVKRSVEKIDRIIVNPKSKACSASLEELEIELKTGCKVIAIRRGEHWIYGPAEATKLEQKDSLLVIGPERGLGDLREFLEGKKEILE